MRAGSATFAAMVLAMLLPGCDGDEQCDVACPAVACLDPFALSVRDAATQALIPDASGSSEGLSCSPNEGFVRCDTRGVAGTYDVELAAPGYVSTHVFVNVSPPPLVGECECPKCQEWQPTSATLEPVD